MLFNLLKDKKPIATESGCWDGLRTEKLIVKTFSGQYHIARMYAGVLDGSEFADFYDMNDFEISNVKWWAEIVSPD